MNKCDLKRDLNKKESFSLVYFPYSILLYDFSESLKSYHRKTLKCTVEVLSFNIYCKYGVENEPYKHFFSERAKFSFVFVWCRCIYYI